MTSASGSYWIRWALILGELAETPIHIRPCRSRPVDPQMAVAFAKAGRVSSRVGGAASAGVGGAGPKKLPLRSSYELGRRAGSAPPLSIQSRAPASPPRIRRAATRLTSFSRDTTGAAGPES